jgi:hypothetical protein
VNRLPIRRQYAFVETPVGNGDNVLQAVGYADLVPFAGYEERQSPCVIRCAAVSS